jgi:predicted dinucleotide-binding enzyme
MKIGIIGTGNIGGTLARHLARLGHDVSIANSRGPETLARLAAETGATAVTVPQAAGVRRALSQRPERSPEWRAITRSVA